MNIWSNLIHDRLITTFKIVQADVVFYFIQKFNSQTTFEEVLINVEGEDVDTMASLH